MAVRVEGFMEMPVVVPGMRPERPVQRERRLGHSRLPTHSFVHSDVPTIVVDVTNPNPPALAQGRNDSRRIIETESCAPTIATPVEDIKFALQDTSRPMIHGASGMPSAAQVPCGEARVVRVGVATSCDDGVQSGGVIKGLGHRACLCFPCVLPFFDIGEIAHVEGLFVWRIVVECAILGAFGTSRSPSLPSHDFAARCCQFLCRLEGAGHRAIDLKTPVFHAMRPDVGIRSSSQYPPSEHQ